MWFLLKKLNIFFCLSIQLWKYVTTIVNTCFFYKRLFSENIQRKLSLYSVFLRFCFCERSCCVKDKQNICHLCSMVKTSSSEDKVLFKDIIFDWRDFSQKFFDFSREYSLMSLSVFWNSSRWLTKF